MLHLSDNAAVRGPSMAQITRAFLRSVLKIFHPPEGCSKGRDEAWGSHWGTQAANSNMSSALSNSESSALGHWLAILLINSMICIGWHRDALLAALGSAFQAHSNSARLLQSL